MFDGIGAGLSIPLKLLSNAYYLRIFHWIFKNLNLVKNIPINRKQTKINLKIDSRFWSQQIKFARTVKQPKCHVCYLCHQNSKIHTSSGAFQSCKLFIIIATPQKKCIKTSIIKLKLIISSVSQNNSHTPKTYNSLASK